MTGYPIQPAKVQSPVLRDETLARDRLLDWLAAKIHQRVILLIADAGYGKTTLLADFARRTRLRTLWYRLDPDDRDWVSFLSHLVAAGREHDPGFAPSTAAMLSDTSGPGPMREATTELFLRELPSIAGHGAVLIIDDFHLVDESPEIRQIARELVARGPERLSILFASRRIPGIPLARLRASGEVSELGTDELRFDASETAQLFAETYRRPLEPDVLADVVARTEGWAASLQLVETALRDRSPAEIRRFVRSMTGADQDLYDYLAEEVVGDLSEDLQQFLMRTAILQVVTPELAAVVSGLEPDAVATLTADAERLTLLGRASRMSRGRQRYHPLVREFLEARLRATAGDQAVAALHHRVADHAAATDWSLAAYHYRLAGDQSAVAAVLDAAIPEVMSKAAYGLAGDFIGTLPADLHRPTFRLITARLQMQRRDMESAHESSVSLLEQSEPGTASNDYALLNLMTISALSGDAVEADEAAELLRVSTREQPLRQIAEGLQLILETNKAGSLDATAMHLATMAEGQRGHSPHFYGVTMLNSADIALLKDDPAAALSAARDAIDALRETSSNLELSAALMVQARAQAALGDLEDAIRTSSEAQTLGQPEATLEFADLADTFLDPTIAPGLLESVGRIRNLTWNERVLLGWQVARMRARRGDFDQAEASLAAVEAANMGSLPAQRASQSMNVAYVAAAASSPLAIKMVEEAIALASIPGATSYRRISELLRGLLGTGDEVRQVVVSVGEPALWNLTFVADMVIRRLADLTDRELQVVAHACRLHPPRWRYVLRSALEPGDPNSSLAAARLLESIGERSDIATLRGYAKRHRRSPGAAEVGKALARRIAEPVFVEDQVRVGIRIGTRVVPGSTIRRKVLGLLCLLLTRPGLACTRDQVLEALWPGLDPEDALNSLHQTVYFLRRVLEENYVDDLSPGYLRHDGDVVWLDGDLVTSRSNECRRLIKALPSVPTPEQVERLVETYKGRFALDFEYEEWAVPYRDWLHAAFLEVVERALASDLETGHFHRGIPIARRVLDIDPDAEHVELSLLRLYRSSGAHAAAAEQYEHYATSLRDQLGVEPPPLESL